MTNKVTKIFTVMGMATVLVAAGYLLLAPAPVKSAHQYSGTFYIAGMGGHFAVAEALIDPSADPPIKITSLDRIEIGESSTHPTHDPRIDVTDRNTMFWSTYKVDKSANGQLHVGKSDLKTGNVLADKTVAVPDRAEWTGANYCASGQSQNYYMPVSMAMEGYIDVIDKKTMEVKERVFLDKVLADKNYKFLHGTNTPDGKGFLLSVNKSTPKTKDSWDTTGDLEMILLDMAALEKGEAKVIKRHTIKGGNPKSTIAFRQYYSPDGKTIFQSANDLFYVIDGSTLELIAKENRQGGGNHDAIPTPDGKYTILTLRTQYEVGEEKYNDGTLQLYDVANKKVVGGTVSVCKSCHDDADYEGNAILCGIEANWK